MKINKSQMGFAVTIFAAIAAIVGQILTYIDNEKLEKEKKEQSDKINELLKENNEIASRNEKLNEENKNLSMKLTSFSEELLYFNQIDFSYLENVAFPNGFTVFKQINEEQIFKKVYGKRLFFEQYDVKIIETSKGNFSAYMYNMRILPHQEGSIQMTAKGENASVTKTMLDVKSFDSRQVIIGIPLIKGMVLALVMLNSEEGYTFAVGWTPSVK